MDPSPGAPAASPLAERLAASAKLRQRRYELLPLSGPGSVHSEVQGRTPGDATSDEGLADLISSIGRIGVLSPILVEQLPHGAMLLVAGERRLRACRRGAILERDNPHFQSVPALVCPGPLTDEERRTWQLVENFHRTDLQPGELAAALVLERCAVLAARLEAEGALPSVEVLAIAEPMERWAALSKVRVGKEKRRISVPWSEIIRELGLQFSEDKVVQLVRAFAQMPSEISEEMDAEAIRLSARLSYVKLARGNREAAEELWAAVRDSRKGKLLSGAVRETIEHPEIDPATAIARAEELVAEANEARAETLRRPAGDEAPPEDLDASASGDPVEGDAAAPPSPDAVPGELVREVIEALSRLVGTMRSGAVVARYDAGSLRLYLAELAPLLGEVEPAAPAAVPSGAV